MFVRFGVIWYLSIRCFVFVSGWKIVMILCSMLCMLNGICLSIIWFDLIFDRFSMLLIMCSSMFDDDMIVLSCCVF